MSSVSFIIPAFNSEKTIVRAIDSILNQKKSSIDYEIIVVDDGSKDNTENIVKSIISDKIKYFKEENKGLSDARNFGVEKANGDYLIFVDSDDFVKNSLLFDIEKYINLNIDLIKYNPIIIEEKDINNEIEQVKKNNISENANQYEKKNIEEDVIFTTGEEGFNLLYGKDPLMVTAWSYAIKKEIFIKFPSRRNHEDFATTPLLMLKAKSMCITKLQEYYYVQTKSSITRGKTKEKERKNIEDILFHYDNLLNEINNNKIVKEKTKQNFKIFITNSLLVIFKDDLYKENREYLISELRKRKVYKNLKAKNIKQLIKKILVFLLTK